jgi:predicted ferric reductase
MVIDHDRDAAALGSRCHGASATGRNSPTGVDEVIRTPQSQSVLPGGTPIRDLPLPWYVAKRWGIVLCAAYVVAAVTPLILLVALRSSFDHPRLMEVGVDIALVGFTLLSLQFVLAGRFAWIEGPFGLDRLMRFHRVMGIVVAALLLTHPLLLIPKFGPYLLTRFRVHWYLWAGRFGAIILLLHMLTALLRRVLPFRYETWRHLHTVAALMLLTIGALHSLAIGDDLANIGARVLWLAVAGVGVGTWGYSRVVRPLLMRCPARGHLFSVVSVSSEAPNVWTVILSRVAKRKTSPFKYAPGQFQFIRIRHESRWSGEHPFTIASSPARNEEICLTIKGCGDFTSNIGLVQKGELATIHGPFGRFSHLFYPEERDLIFIAGGVGITPHLSMLRYMRDTRDPRPVLLLYASRRETDILFGKELEEMERDGFPNLTVVHFLSEPTRDWHGESGRIDADHVVWRVGELDGKAFYLCCPPPMTRALLRGLKRYGVSSHSLHTDFFAI